MRICIAALASDRIESHMRALKDYTAALINLKQLRGMIAPRLHQRYPLYLPHRPLQNLRRVETGEAGRENKPRQLNLQHQLKVMKVRIDFTLFL